MRKLKNLFPYLLIAIFTGWFCYKFFVERKIPEEAKMTLDWDELENDKNPLKAASSGAEVSKKEVLKVREHSTLSQGKEEEFKAFDEMEENWLATVKGILDPTQYSRYIEMREQNEKEKAIAYKEYHEFLRQKYGDQFSYHISEDQSHREKEINDHYLKELEKIIGKEKFQQYQFALDKVNEENRKKNKEFIQVEF